MELTLGTDWGSYLYWDERIQFDWAQLYDQAGLRFAIFRGDQEQISATDGNYSTLRNLEAARRGLPVVGCYYWHYPYRNLVTLYMDRYRRAIDREKPDFIGVDLEQTKVMKDGIEVQVDPQEFSDTGQALCEGLHTAYPEKQLVPYTRRDIITTYSPPMVKWIGRFDGGWEAAGQDYGLMAYSLSWEQIRDFLCRTYPTGELRRVDDTGATTIPTWTHNKFRQYSGRILYPYTSGTIYGHQYDTNCFFGTEADLIAWVRKLPPLVVENKPTIEDRLESLERRVTALEANN